MPPSAVARGSFLPFGIRNTIQVPVTLLSLRCRFVLEGDLDLGLDSQLQLLLGRLVVLSWNNSNNMPL